MAKRMNDEDLISILRKEEAASRFYQDGTLSPIRIDALNYYDRMPYGDEQEGSSKVVTSEFHDAIESMMPGLMEVFAGSDQIVKFAPVAMGHEAAMEEANSYVPHCFMAKNNGFLILSATLKDALMSRLGGISVDLDTQKKTRDFDLQGLTQDDIDMILAEGESQDMDIEMDLAPDPPMPMPAGGNMPGQALPMPMPMETFSGKVTVTRMVQEVVVDAIAPEGILFTPTAHNQDECSMLGYFKVVTAGDLHKLGIPQDEIDQLDSRRPINPEEDQRTDGAAAIIPERSTDDDSERQLWLVLAYVKADFEGTGESTAERVLYAHAGGVAASIIERTPWDEPFPIALATPILMPHVIAGRSIFDETKDLQQINSALTRGMLDGMYVSIRPRPAVSDKVILDSLLDWVPGAPIRFAQGAKPGDGHILWEKPPSVLPDALAALEYFNTVQEKRVGTNRMSNQGMDADSLNKTFGGAKLSFSASSQRQKLIARTFAETFLVRAYRLIYRAIKRGATGEISYWAGDGFKKADPTKWPDDMDLTVDVGLGTGNTEQELGHLTVLANVQEKLVQLQGGTAGPFVKPDNVANLSQKFSEKLGFKTPGIFFQPPEKVEEETAKRAQQEALTGPPVPPEVQAEQAKTAGAIEVQKAQLAGDLQQLQAEQAVNAEKAQGDAAIKQMELAAKQEMDARQAQLHMEEMRLKQEEIDLKRLELAAKREQMAQDAANAAHDREHEVVGQRHERMMARMKGGDSDVDAMSDMEDGGKGLAGALHASVQASQSHSQMLAEALQRGLQSVGEGLAKMADAVGAESEITLSSGKTVRSRKVPRSPT